MPETVHSSCSESRATQLADVIWFKRKRYYVVLLIFCGELLRTMQQINMSIALVAMTSTGHVTNQNGTYIRNGEPEFKWNSVEQGLILSCFSWGSIFSFLSALLTEKFGGSRILGIGLAINGILTTLTPIVVRFNTTLFVITRVCEGLTEALSSAAYIEVLLYWTPPQERSCLSAGAMSGVFIGPAIAFPLCGIVAKRYGWEMTFFASGAVSLLWFVIWWIFVSRTPATDGFISETEKKFITEQVNVSPLKKLKYPWKEIITSKSMWAYMNERFVQLWSVSFILYCLPIYIKDVGNIDIDDIGYVSSLPHLTAFFGMMMSGCLSDYLRNKRVRSISDIHKILIACGQFGCIIFLILITMWKDFVGIMVCLCALKMVFTLAEICYVVLPNDMGQQYSSLITALSGSLQSISSIMNPIMMGLLVSNHTTAEWSNYFIFLCCFNVWGAVIFCLFGSGELEPWAVTEKANEEHKQNDHKQLEKAAYTNYNFEM